MNYIRKVTVHRYINKEATSHSERTILKGNEDPFKKCKTLKDVRKVLLCNMKDFLLKEFKVYGEEGNVDFLTVKIDKRNLSSFQQITIFDLHNSTRFIMDD